MLLKAYGCPPVADRPNRSSSVMDYIAHPADYRMPETVSDLRRTRH